MGLPYVFWSVRRHVKSCEAQASNAFPHILLFGLSPQMSQVWSRSKRDEERPNLLSLSLFCSKKRIFNGTFFARAASQERWLVKSKSRLFRTDKSSNRKRKKNFFIFKRRRQKEWSIKVCIFAFIGRVPSNNYSAQQTSTITSMNVLGLTSISMDIAVFFFLPCCIVRYMNFQFSS
jgi:hypothetical protein